MASRKQKKKATGETATVSAAPNGQEQKSAAPAASATKKKAAKGVAVRRAAPRKRRGPGRPKGSKTRTHAAKQPTATKSARSRRHTPAERAKILAAAKREGLSGPAAAKKFGISQLTFYTWRKKVGTTRSREPLQPTRRGRPVGGHRASSSLVELMRGEIRARVERMLPEIVRAEVESVFTSSNRSGGRRSR